MKILLGYFNSKVGREDIFKPTTGNENLHEFNNDNGVPVVRFATSKHVIVESTLLLYRDVHKYTSTSDVKTHNQTDHVLIGKRRYSNIVDVRSYRGANCDTDHYVVVAKVRHRVSVSKRATQKFHMERYNLKKINDVEVKRTEG
jgi:hypothetical protein